MANNMEQAVETTQPTKTVHVSSRTRNWGLAWTTEPATDGPSVRGVDSGDISYRGSRAEMLRGLEHIRTVTSGGVYHSVALYVGNDRVHPDDLHAFGRRLTTFFECLDADGFDLRVIVGDAHNA